jgi:hypothetical protein
MARSHEKGVPVLSNPNTEISRASQVLTHDVVRAVWKAVLE